MLAVSRSPELLLNVIAAGEHLLAKGHHVWGFWEVKVFVAPHLARGSAARLHLVYQQRRASLCVGDVLLYHTLFLT